MGNYVGLDQTDIAACYRHCGMTVADLKPEERPLCVVNIEFYANGDTALALFGATTDMTHGQSLSLFIEAIRTLSEAASNCNAQASN